MGFARGPAMRVLQPTCLVSFLTREMLAGVSPASCMQQTWDPMVKELRSPTLLDREVRLREVRTQGSGPGFEASPILHPAENPKVAATWFARSKRRGRIPLEPLGGLSLQRPPLMRTLLFLRGLIGTPRGGPLVKEGIPFAREKGRGKGKGLRPLAKLIAFER